MVAFMDCFNAITEVLDTARRIKLPHYRFDVVTIARREFARSGGCDNKFIAPIEDTLRECLRKWSLAQKREIWLSTETGAASSHTFEDYDESGIDMDLEGELMYHIIEELSPQQGRSSADRNEESDGF
jgi:hypothetical protein